MKKKLKLPPPTYETAVQQPSSQPPDSNSTLFKLPEKAKANRTVKLPKIGDGFSDIYSERCSVFDHEQQAPFSSARLAPQDNNKNSAAFKKKQPPVATNAKKLPQSLLSEGDQAPDKNYNAQLELSAHSRNAQHLQEQPISLDQLEADLPEPTIKTSQHGSAHFLDIASSQFGQVMQAKSRSETINYYMMMELPRQRAEVEIDMYFYKRRKSIFDCIKRCFGVKPTSKEAMLQLLSLSRTQINCDYDAILLTQIWDILIQKGTVQPNNNKKVRNRVMDSFGDVEWARIGLGGRDPTMHIRKTGILPLFMIYCFISLYPEYARKCVAQSTREGMEYPFCSCLIKLCSGVFVKLMLRKQMKLGLFEQLAEEYFSMAYRTLESLNSRDQGCEVKTTMSNVMKELMKDREQAKLEWEEFKQKRELRAMK